jgi:hypothetical protein
MARVCTNCGQAKTMDDFFKDARASDGCRSRCKSCERHRPRDAFKAKEQDRRYHQRHPGAKALANQAYRRRYPGKGSGVPQPAHRLVHNALRRGELVKPQVCQGCGQPARLDAHHDDYARPLAVRWLCRRCHAGRHAEVRHGLS